MADIFMQSDSRALLKNKHVLFLGDSNVRGLYKDLTWLLNNNTLICERALKTKLEHSYLGDTLVERSELNHGRDYKEHRLYYDRANDTRLEFMFLTRCYSGRLLNVFNGIMKKERLVPDVVVISSCLWDLTRWGPNGVPEYKDNMVRLMILMSRCLPKQCLVIWTTSLPVAPHVKGGLILKQIESVEPLLRFHVMEANLFAREVVVSHGFDVLDYHYHLRMQMHRRAKDGVHYLPVPVRFLTNLLLTHIALTWNKNLPNRIRTILLDKASTMDSKPTEKPEGKKATSGVFPSTAGTSCSRGINVSPVPVPQTLTRGKKHTRIVLLNNSSTMDSKPMEKPEGKKATSGIFPSTAGTSRSPGINVASPVPITRALTRGKKHTRIVLLNNSSTMDSKPMEKPEGKKATSGIFPSTAGTSRSPGINVASPVPITRGITVTFSPQQSGRQCKLFESEIPMASSTFTGETASKVKMVIELPQNKQEPHAAAVPSCRIHNLHLKNQEPYTAARPYRRKQNKEKRKANCPYPEISYRNHHPSNTPPPYNPYPSYIPTFYNGRYYPYGNNYPNGVHHDDDSVQYNYQNCSDDEEDDQYYSNHEEDDQYYSNHEEDDQYYSNHEEDDQYYSNHEEDDHYYSEDQ